MADVLSQIEKILALEDPQQRIDQLLAYARARKVNVLKTLREDGGYNENELVVLIYDAEQRKKENRASQLGMLLAALFIFVIVAAAILLTYYMMTSAAK